MSVEAGDRNVNLPTHDSGCWYFDTCFPDSTSSLRYCEAWVSLVSCVLTMWEFPKIGDPNYSSLNSRILL